MGDITNFVRIESNSKLDMSPEGDFFQTWVEFLTPVHKLTKRERGVLTEFLKKRYELSKVIIDQNTLDRILMQRETKAEIREACKMSVKHFNGIIYKFRKRGVLVNEKIRLNLIPTFTDEGAGLMIHFNFNNEQHNKSGNN